MTQQFTDDPQSIPGGRIIAKGIIRAYTAGTHKANVQLVGSHPTVLTELRVATDIPAADVVAGRQCTVLFLDPANQDDAVVLTIQGALPSGGGGGGLTHAPVGALYPGILSVGVKSPQVPYKGAAWTAVTLYCRVTTAPQTTAITVQVRRNGTSLGAVTIAAAAQTGSLTISQAIADGDYFDINITATGTAPNEGSDLVWLVAP